MVHRAFHPLNHFSSWLKPKIFHSPTRKSNASGFFLSTDADTTPIPEKEVQEKQSLTPFISFGEIFESCTRLNKICSHASEPIDGGFVFISGGVSELLASDFSFE